MSTVTFGPWVGRITHGTYDNGRAALRLIGKMGPIATCTVNLFDKKMEQDEVAIKDYAENEGMLDALMDAGVVQHPHRYVLVMMDSGPEAVPICRMSTQETLLNGST